MFSDAIQSILCDLCDTDAVRRIEAGGSADALAGALQGAGFHELLGPESDGGGAATWTELYGVVKLFGACALPLPLSQTIAARSMVHSASELPANLLTFAPSIRREAGDQIQALNVPAGRLANHVLGFLDGVMVLLSADTAHRIPTGVHASMAMSFRWKAQAARPLEGRVNAEEFQAMGALLHAGLLVGAMKQAFDLTLGYANERMQFGKTLGKFQAIQHQLAVMAEHLAAASLLTEAAFSGLGELPAPAACAVAKARASEAAQLIASLSHAVHGAIGVSQEYNLQLSTRRLHEWRIAHGSESFWNLRVGRLCLARADGNFTDFVRSLC